MNKDESIVVSFVIEKLHPSWKRYKREIKHKTKYLTLEQLVQNLWVEEETGCQEGNDDTSKVPVRSLSASSRAAMVSVRRKSKILQFLVAGTVANLGISN